MPAKNPPHGDDRDLNLATLSDLFTNEDAAREFVESQIWPEGPVCPHCGSKEHYTLTARPDSKKPVRKGVYKCKSKDCRKQFTVRIGTIFEDSKIPFSKWIMTMHLMTSSKKGISSLQISRELGITVKSAWFMTHRIREAMRHVGPREPMGGIVEADETYVGGKPRKDGTKHTGGRGTAKQPVMVLVERDGRARAFPVPNVTGKTLKNEIAVQVAKEAIVMTDEFGAYVGLRDDNTHRTVKHKGGQYSYVDDDGMLVTTNTAESFFALRKRGHYGTFHQLSKKHLHRYCDEFSFRWDRRKISDGERMVDAIKGAKGKRLMYVQPAAKEAS